MAESLIPWGNNSIYIRNNVSLDLATIARSDSAIKDALLPYMNKAGTTLVNMRFQGGQHCTALVAGSGGYSQAIVFTYYNAGIIDIYRYHANNGWTKYTLTGTPA